MRQAHRWLVIAALGVTGIAGVTACGQPDTATGSLADTATESTVEVVEALGAEAGALAAMGFNPADLALADPAPTATPSTGPQRRGEAGRGEAWRKRHAYRVLLRRNTLHGEAVVKGRDGTTRTVVVQRGTVTALTDTTITVKSTDGYTLTWTFGDPLHVIEHRASIKASEIGVGTEVGVAGAKEGSATVARLIVIPRK